MKTIRTELLRGTIGEEEEAAKEEEEEAGNLIPENQALLFLSEFPRFPQQLHLSSLGFWFALCLKWTLEVIMRLFFQTHEGVGLALRTKHFALVSHVRTTRLICMNLLHAIHSVRHARQEAFGRKAFECTDRGFTSVRKPVAPLQGTR